MTNKKYTLKDAEKFVEEFQKTNDLAKVLNDFDCFKQSLKIFVNRNDEEKFKQLTDRYFEIVDFSEKKDIKKGAYHLLETLCYEVDNQTILRKGSAVKLFEDVYLRRIKMKYDINGYSPEEIYEKIDSFSDILIVRYPNLINNSEKKWNNKKDRMNFKFYSRGHNISGNMQVHGRELLIEGKIPLVARPYRKEIIKRIEKTLEIALPKLPAFH